MGVLNGNIILSNFNRGLYNRLAKTYEIYVDGELMRYKGMISENLARHDAEHGVAHTAFTYLCKLITKITQHMDGREADKITVFMDGERVTNKVCHSRDFQLNTSLIRTLFMRLCMNAGMIVNNLTYGESELQMHIKHNKEQPLSIYITSDSDLISILYGHKPNINGKNVEFRSKIYSDDQIDIANCSNIVINDQNDVFQDSNLIYVNSDDFKVTNSIAWVNCNKDVITIYGMDNTICNGRFEAKAFHTFMAVCGTDFTPNALPVSMMTGIFNINDEDLNFINELDEAFEIFACLLIVGYKNGGSLKQKKEPNNINVQRQDVNNMINYYTNYVTTGVMVDECIVQPPMSWLTRYLLWCSSDKQEFKTKKSHVHYLKNAELSTLISNINKNYDSTENQELFYNQEFKTDSRINNKLKLKRLIT